MAACCVVSEDLAICTCCRMATRSSRASSLSSASLAAESGWQHNSRIRAQSTSIRASVTEGTAGAYSSEFLRAIQRIPEKKPNTGRFNIILRIRPCPATSLRAINSYSAHPRPRQGRSVSIDFLVICAKSSLQTQSSGLAMFVPLLNFMDDEIHEQPWRELCLRAANESDPHRLSQLVDELIRALDARKQALDISRRRAKPASKSIADDN
jgi:hypothetical protein